MQGHTAIESAPGLTQGADDLVTMPGTLKCVMLLRNQQKGDYQLGHWGRTCNEEE